MERNWQIVNNLANFLDNQFNFLGIKFGYAAFINLIPGIGDALDAILSFYIVYLAIQLKVPFHKVWEMIGNIIVNFFIGTIPLIGDAAYILRRVNIKNLKIIKQYAPTSVVEGQIIQN